MDLRLPFDFASPELLLLLVPLIGLTLLVSSAARHHLSRGRRLFGLGVRTLIISALVFALAGFQLVLPVDRLTSIFVVDLSDSVGEAGRQSALAFVREALERRPDGDRAGVVAFGGEALVERIPRELEELERFASVPNRSATDIGAALRLATALFPDESQKRIVLVSDGNDTTGRGQSEAALAAARGVQVETHVVGIGAADEVVLQELRTPSTARVGEEIEAEVTITSTVRQQATVRLFADGAQVGLQAVTLEAGTTRVVFTVRAQEAGLHTFRAVVEAGADTFPQNDRADSDTVVKGDPRILVVAGDEAVTAQLVDALRAERQDVTRLVPEAMPPDLAGLAAYDSVVLVDVAAARLGAQRMALLQTYTRDLGRGLVMVGGERSYGAGGYKLTPLEEALPVDMDVRDRKREPDIALVVVIDRSGSMDACHCNNVDRDQGTAIDGIPKVDIGKEAILRAVGALTGRDEFGVVAFNENAQWVIHTAPLGQVGDVEGQIAGITPDGQTNIFAGLSQAVESLEGTTATRRHIVLLTDGWSSSGEYEQLLTRMKAANITLSAVGAGGGGANDFLEGLAERGGGRFYPATDASTIPDIFLKETQQVSGQQIVEETFFPIQTGDSPILRGLEQGLPQLKGYNGTTPKAAAQTVLVSSRDDPILAQWQYGLGRSVAWTSDATGRWASNWVAWPGFNRFFSQLVAWTFPGEEAGGIEAEFVTEGDRTTLRLRSAESDGSPRNFYETEARITTPGMVSAAPVSLVQTAPGVYEVPLGRLDPGAYAVRVDQRRAGATPLGRTVVLIAPTPAEYRLLGTNEALLAALRGATSGRALSAGAEAWRHDLEQTTTARELWPVLLLLAMLLWPLDVAIRRVALRRGDLAEARGWIGSRWARRRASAARPERVGGMLAAKERAAGRSRTALFTGAATDARAGAADDAAVGSESAAVGAGTPEGTGGRAASAETAPVPAGTTSGDGNRESPADDKRGDTLARLREAKRRAQR